MFSPGKSSPPPEFEDSSGSSSLIVCFSSFKVCFSSFKVCFSSFIGGSDELSGHNEVRLADSGVERLLDKLFEEIEVSMEF